MMARGVAPSRWIILSGHPPDKAPRHCSGITEERRRCRTKPVIACAVRAPITLRWNRSGRRASHDSGLAEGAHPRK